MQSTRPEDRAVRTSNRKFIAVASGAVLAGAAIVGAVVVRRGHAASPASSSIDADLKLASATPDIGPYALTETAPSSKPMMGVRLHRAEGPKAIRSSRPRVKAAPDPEPAADENAAPVTESVAQAPGAGPTEAPAEPTTAATPRPVPVPVTYPSGGGDARGSGDVGNGSGAVIGAVIGGILGAVIRGGGVDGDNCEIPRRGTRRGRPGVFTPNTGGIYMPITGGIGTGSRFPIRIR